MTSFPLGKRTEAILSEEFSLWSGVAFGLIAIGIASATVLLNIFWLPLLLSAAIGGAIVCIRYPMVWMLAIPMAMIPWLISHNDKDITGIEIGVVGFFWGTLGLWFLWQILFRRQKIIRSGVDFLFLFFLLWLFGNGIVAVSAGTSPLQWFREWLLFTFVVFYFPFRHHLQTEQQRVAMFYSISLMAIGIGIFNVRKYLTALGNIEYAFELVSNRVALNEDVFVAMSVFTLIAFLYNKKLWQKISLLGIFLFFLGNLIATFSRGFWVSFILASVLMFPLMGAKKAIKTTITGLGMLAVAYVFALTFLGEKGELAIEIITNRFTSVSKAGTDQSLNSRVAESRVLLNLIEKQPLTGYGFGTKFTFYDPLIQMDRHTNFIHNGYISATFKFGLFGAILFYSLIVAVAFRGYFTAWRMKDCADRRIIMSASVILVGMLLVNMTSAQISTRGGLFWFAFLMACIEGIRAHQKQLQNT